MARTARQMDMSAADEALQQASFDFLPEDMRRHRRFGSEDAADWAERRAKLKVIDRQVISTGSRLAAARLREILRPDEPKTAIPENLSEADHLSRSAPISAIWAPSCFTFVTNRRPRRWMMTICSSSDCIRGHCRRAISPD